MFTSLVWIFRICIISYTYYYIRSRGYVLARQYCIKVFIISQSRISFLDLVLQSIENHQSGLIIIWYVDNIKSNILLCKVCLCIIRISIWVCICNIVNIITKNMFAKTVRQLPRRKIIVFINESLTL